MPDQPIPQLEKPIHVQPEQHPDSFVPIEVASEAIHPQESMPETMQQTETPKETLPTKEQETEEGIETLKQKLRKPKKQKSTTVPQVRDELTLRVEKIMEEGIADAYRELTPIQKQEFKLKGEEVAYKIRQLLGGARIKVKSIFKLLVEWLKLLPGVNRFFLEQEAKIKADKIVTLHEHYGKTK
jgi:hypothetical protein